MTTNHARRHDHERESQKRKDRQEVLDRPDELPRFHAAARPVGKHQEEPPRGADTEKPEQIEQGIMPFRRGGIWYDPTSFPELEKKIDH